MNQHNVLLHISITSYYPIVPFTVLEQDSCNIVLLLCPVKGNLADVYMLDITYISQWWTIYNDQNIKLCHFAIIVYTSFNIMIIVPCPKLFKNGLDVFCPCCRLSVLSRRNKLFGWICKVLDFEINLNNYFVNTSFI